MKTCSKCKECKDISEFAWRSKPKNILHNQCNICRRETAKNSYNKHKENIVAAVRERNSINKDIALQWKSKLYCVCCGESYTKCLDFHHLDPSEKEHDISGMISRYPLASIIKEAEKCIIVCSNCHRKIHDNAIVITDDIKEKSSIMFRNNSL